MQKLTNSRAYKDITGKGFLTPRFAETSTKIHNCYSTENSLLVVFYYSDDASIKAPCKLRVNERKKTNFCPFERKTNSLD